MAYKFIKDFDDGEEEQEEEEEEEEPTPTVESCVEMAKLCLDLPEGSPEVSQLLQSFQSVSARVLFYTDMKTPKKRINFLKFLLEDGNFNHPS